MPQVRHTKHTHRRLKASKFATVVVCCANVNENDHNHSHSGCCTAVWGIPEIKIIKAYQGHFLKR